MQAAVLEHGRFIAEGAKDDWFSARGAGISARRTLRVRQHGQEPV